MPERRNATDAVTGRGLHHLRIRHGYGGSEPASKPGRVHPIRAGDEHEQRPVILQEQQAFHDRPHLAADGSGCLRGRMRALVHGAYVDVDSEFGRAVTESLHGIRH